MFQKKIPDVLRGEGGVVPEVGSGTMKLPLPVPAIGRAGSATHLQDTGNRILLFCGRYQLYGWSRRGNRKVKLPVADGSCVPYLRLRPSRIPTPLNVSQKKALSDVPPLNVSQREA